MFCHLRSCLLSLLALMTCLYSQEEQPAANKVETNVGEKESTIRDQTYFLPISEANNHFGFELYKKIVSSQKNGNICLAPFCLYNALGMVLGGADGATKVELGNLLGFKGVEEDFFKRNKELNKLFTFHPSSFPEDFQISLANSLWVQSSFPILPSYFKFVDEFYRGDFRRVDFMKQPETARSGINRWVKEQTQGRISDLISSHNIEDVRMLVASAFYMRARWQQGFDTRITKNTPFYPKSDRIISIPMMTQTSRLNYFQDDKLAALEIPFIKMKSADLTLTFMIIVPKEIEDFERFENELNGNFMQDLLAKMKSKQVIASIPKFKMFANYSLEDILQQLGLSVAFTSEADFSNMTGSKDLSLGRILQKTYFNLDEKGVEAAAASSVEMIVTSAREEPVLFRADRPFVYFVIDRFSNTILFMGRLVNPLEN